MEVQLGGTADRTMDTCVYVLGSTGGCGAREGVLGAGSALVSHLDWMLPRNSAGFLSALVMVT